MLKNTGKKKFISRLDARGYTKNTNASHRAKDSYNLSEGKMNISAAKSKARKIINEEIKKLPKLEHMEIKLDIDPYHYYRNEVYVTIRFSPSKKGISGHSHSNEYFNERDKILGLLRKCSNPSIIKKDISENSGIAELTVKI